MSNPAYRKTAWIMALAFIIALVYWRCLKVPFFQDDFGWFYAFSANKASALALSVWSFEGKLFYRPLTQLYMLGMYCLFGESPAAFHVVSLVLLFFNSLLVGLIIERVTENERLGFLSAILYALSIPVNLDSQLWMVGTYDLLCVLFFLLSFLLYIRGKLFLSVAAFVLSLLSKESSITLPLVLLAYHVICERFSSGDHEAIPAKRRLAAGICFAVVMLLGLAPKVLAHALYVNFPSTHPYVIKLAGTHVIVNLAAYPAWMIQTLVPFLRTRDPVFAAFAILFCLCALWAAAVLVRKKREVPLVSRAVFLLLWAALGLGPAMFLVNHRYGYYAIYSLPAFVAFVLLVFDTALHVKVPRHAKAIVALAIALVLCGDLYQSRRLFKYRLNESVNRAAIVAEVRRDLKRYQPELPQGAVLIFEGLDTEIFAKENGPRFWYNNRTIEVYEADQVGRDATGAYVLDEASQTDKYMLLGEKSLRRYIDLRKAYMFRFTGSGLTREEPEEMIRIRGRSVP